MLQGMHYVYEVYKEMSFSKAAHNLYISQPSLSAAVKKAEEKVGFPIFDRSTNPIRLTALGKEYIKVAEQITQIESDFENYISDFNDMRTGSLSIGATNLYASYLLPPVLTRYTEKYPLIKIDLVEDSSQELAQKLLAGKLDLIIDNTALDRDVFDSQLYEEDHLVLTVPRRFRSNEAAAPWALTAGQICRKEHLDPAVEEVPLHLFQNDPFLLLTNGNDTRQRADCICLKNAFSPKIRLELEQQITAYHLTCAGMGISFNGDSTIAMAPKNEDLVYYKLDPVNATRKIQCYFKRNRYMTRAAREFLKML